MEACLSAVQQEHRAAPRLQCAASAASGEISLLTGDSASGAAGGIALRGGRASGSGSGGDVVITLVMQRDDCGAVRATSGQSDTLQVVKWRSLVAEEHGQKWISFATNRTQRNRQH